MKHIKRTIVALIISCCAPMMWADTVPVNVTIRNTHNSSSKDKLRGETPAPSISIYYDSDNQTIEVSCPVDDDGETSLYNSAGIVVAYDTSINTTLDVSSLTGGTYTVVITTDDWEASGSITL